MNHRPVPRIDAYIWWCGDMYCDCTQPVVELIEDAGSGPPRTVKRTRLWTGTFISSATRKEYDDQERELGDARELFGIGETGWREP